MKAGELKKILEHVPDNIHLVFTVECDEVSKKRIEQSLNNGELWLRLNGYSRDSMDLTPIEDQVFSLDFIPEQW